MVLLGGLEFVVGGYLVHKHYKNKSEKRRLEEETDRRRHNTFPGAAKPSSQYHQQQQQHQKPCAVPQQKHAYYAHPQPQPQPQPPSYYQQPRFHHEPSRVAHPPTIPWRPVAQQQPPQIIQPLARADSSATISRMPVANGYRPNPPAALPSRQQQRLHYAPNLAPIPQSPYSNHGFSASTPALAISPITPTSPLYGTGANGGRQTIDDNWETYAGQGGYAPSVSTALGERFDDDEPPPPYRP